MTNHEEDELLANALHASLPQAAIERLCHSIANNLDASSDVRIEASEVEMAVWTWVRFTQLAAARNRDPIE